MSVVYSGQSLPSTLVADLVAKITAVQPIATPAQWWTQIYQVGGDYVLKSSGSTGNRSINVYLGSMITYSSGSYSSWSAGSYYKCMKLGTCTGATSSIQNLSSKSMAVNVGQNQPQYPVLWDLIVDQDYIIIAIREINNGPTYPESCVGYAGYPSTYQVENDSTAVTYLVSNNFNQGNLRCNVIQSKYIPATQANYTVAADNYAAYSPGINNEFFLYPVDIGGYGYEGSRFTIPRIWKTFKGLNQYWYDGMRIKLGSDTYMVYKHWTDSGSYNTSDFTSMQASCWMFIKLT